MSTRFIDLDIHKHYLVAIGVNADKEFWMKWSNKMTKKTSPFDISAHLKSDDDVREFLQEVANTGNTEDLLHALNIAVRAKGVAKIAKEAGVSRTSLYKSLSEDANPGFDTINKIVQAMGYKLEIA